MATDRRLDGDWAATWVAEISTIRTLRVMAVIVAFILRV
jgi:hypothetical protein